MSFRRNDLGLGVVAMWCGTANMQESHRSIVKLEHGHAGFGIAILSKLRMLKGCTRSINFGYFTAEEPTHQIDIMGCRINKDTARGLGKLDAAFDQRLGVETGRFNEVGLADLTCVDLRFGIRIGRIVAAHKAQEEQLVRMTLYGRLRTLALLKRTAERLVGEHMLTSIERVLDHPAVLRRRRYNDNCLDICLVDHFLIVGGHEIDLEIVLCPVQLFLLQRACRDQTTARNLKRQIFRMYRTQTAQTDNTCFDFFHTVFLLYWWEYIPLSHGHKCRTSPCIIIPFPRLKSKQRNRKIPAFARLCGLSGTQQAQVIKYTPSFNKIFIKGT